MVKQNIKKVGIYVRLSKEDDRAGESVSIENQKLMLTNFARDNSWILYEIYCDDGLSGTNQNRPGLQKMLEDIRQKHINTVLIKDLSRLGRNYLEVGNLAEVFFPEHGVELISLSEKVDEMMVFRNWFNEQHSRETSKKVRAVKKICAQNGKYTGAFAPYGYRKADGNKHLLIPDEPAAEIVRKIFEMRSRGLGHKAIAIELNEAGILPPRDYYYSQKSVKNPFKTCNAWTCVAIRGILDNEAYIGNMVQGKYGSASYKSHKLITKPEEEWIRVEGTHKPLINMDLWNTARNIADKRFHPHKRKDGSVSIFCGVLYCADCGFKMRSSTLKSTRKNGKKYVYNRFLCGTYSRSGRAICTPHTIGEDVLHELVANQIREHAKMVVLNEARMIEQIIKTQNKQAISGRALCANELQSRNDRLSTLDKLIEKLYEDRLAGIVPETTFKDFVQKYERERLDCKKAISKLEIKLEKFGENENEASKWAKEIRRFARLEALDLQTVLTLVERIEIGDVIKSENIEKRDVKLIYKYVGKCI
ncbi:MAG: recombinase family protein [Oscillospiraceae bacterium]|nr:recombinase family protein [Oscillospiraceae bacterium]